MPQEYVARWTGGRIGVGASVFHFKSIAGPAQAQPIATAVRALFDTLKAALPDDITVSFDSEVRDLTDAGVLTAVYGVAAPANVVGTNAATYTNGSGLMVRHTTGTIVAGRRLVGRTFFVPVSGASFGNNGEVLATTVTAFNAAFATLKTTMTGGGADFAVWSRKNALTSTVATSVTQSRPSMLRTRNDRL